MTSRCGCTSVGEFPNIKFPETHSLKGRNAFLKKALNDNAEAWPRIEITSSSAPIRHSDDAIISPSVFWKRVTVFCSPAMAIF